MKHVNKFNEFMVNTVNLNQSRIDTLTAKVDVIDRFLRNDDIFGELYIETGLQGSYAHRTIIKPSQQNPKFDADLMVYVNVKNGWEPKDYIEELYKRYRENPTYKNIVGRRTRCVTLDYAGEFHLDVVPCISRDRFLNGETYHVCNRNENIEEKTDPKGYTGWFRDKNRGVGNNYLIKTVRLIKYLRDIKQTFSCKSILLTTLVANQVGGFGDLFEDYDDLPTTLKVVVNNLNAYLQDNVAMPIIQNPVNDEENFNRHWDQDKYTNFRAQIKRYSDWINDAFEERDQVESLKKWRKIFGDVFGQTAAKSAAKATSDPSQFPIPAYVERAPWPMSGIKVTLPLNVTVHKTNDGSPELTSLSTAIGQPIGKYLKIRMEYLGQVANTHNLYWQIVNTGEEAKSAGDLRGKIFYGGKVRWEDTKYKGIHWIECFLVDKKKGICTARSGRYFVNVG